LYIKVKFLYLFLLCVIRFIGELFKQKILTPNIMLYCIVHLVTKHVEEPLECLCILLKTVGKQLEQVNFHIIKLIINDCFNLITYNIYIYFILKSNNKGTLIIH